MRAVHQTLGSLGPGTQYQTRCTRSHRGGQFINTHQHAVDGLKISRNVLLFVVYGRRFKFPGGVRWVSLRLALLPFHSIDYFEKQDVTVLSLYHPFFIPACAHSGSLREFPRLQLPRVRVFSHTYILYILLTLIYITPFFLLSHHFNTGLHPAQNRGLPRSRSKERSRASGRQHRSTILAWYVRRRLFNFHIIL